MWPYQCKSIMLLSPWGAGAYVTLSVFVYPVIIKTKVILPVAYVTLSVFVYHVIIKTKVILPGAYVTLSV